MSFTIFFNNKSNDDVDLDLYITQRPVIPVPTRKYETFEIKGHDGLYYEDLETYDDIVIPIEFNFNEENLDNTKPRVRSIKKWLENVQDRKLILSDDPGYFYYVQNAEINNVESYDEFYELQKFTVNFTVKAYQYLLEGVNEIELKNVLFNNWCISKPIYRIVGNGTCNLNINGTITTLNITNQLTIDTEYNKILEADRKPAIGKSNIKNMSKLFLAEGKNNFSWTNGFRIYITPNYRAL